MSFNSTYMYPQGFGGPRGRSWAYFTEDALSGVDDAQYFNDFVEELRVGDIIYAVKVDDLDLLETDTAAVQDAGFFIVNANDGTDVDTTDITDLTVTDGG